MKFLNFALIQPYYIVAAYFRTPRYNRADWFEREALQLGFLPMTVHFVWLSTAMILHSMFT